MRSSTALIAVALAAAPACKKQDDAPQPPRAVTDSGSPGATVAAPATPSLPPLPQITKWELDPENSSVSFVCKHAMHTNVRGMFQRPKGTVVLDEATPANSSVNATIDVATVTTGVEERDTHLKSPDFFEASRYPVITFASTGLTKSSETGYTVTGNLTMHGVTRPVTLAVTASPPFEHFGTIRRGIEATTSVNRTDFGVGAAAWNIPAEGGGLLVGDSVAITIDAELVLQSDASKGG